MRRKRKTARSCGWNQRGFGRDAVRSGKAGVYWSKSLGAWAVWIGKKRLPRTFSSKSAAESYLRSFFNPHSYTGRDASSYGKRSNKWGGIRMCPCPGETRMPPMATYDPEDVGRDILTRQKRARLPRSAFVFPSRRAWPIHDRKHALIALRYMREGKGRRSDYPSIRRAIRRRYPDLRA